MDGQIGRLPLRAVAVLLSLGLCPLQGEHHVPKGHQAGAGIRLHVVQGGRRAGDQVEHGEGEHIGGAVHVPLLSIDGVDALVVGKQHVHLAGEGHPLRLQDSGDHPAQQRGVGLRSVHLGLDENLVVHVLSSSGPSTGSSASAV